MSKLTIPTFTNLGYKLHARHFEPIDTDMSGRIVVITGSTGGLGLAAARALSLLGAHPVIIGRNRDKLTAVAEELGPGTLTYAADLSLMSAVRELAGRLLVELPRIDVLVNNVGVLLPERQVTAEGLEMTFAANLAGHFLLTNALAARLGESRPARIINVSSGGMYFERIEPDDLQSERDEYKGTASYARTKRAQVILTEIWAERLQSAGIVVHSMHPGWAKTVGVERSLPAFNTIMKPLLRTPEEGADTIVWLAAAERPGRSTGQFWFDRRVAPTHLTDSTRETTTDRLRLWENLVKLTGSNLPITTQRSLKGA